MHSSATPAQGIPAVSGHLQVKGPPKNRKFFASWFDAGGVKRTRTLGRAHVKDTGRRTTRGAIVWRAGDGACPAGALTPKMAEEQLAAILEDELASIPESPAPVDTAPVPTFGEAVEAWLLYLRVERQRKPSTLRDARTAANRHLVSRFGADTPLYVLERHEVAVSGRGRRWELREERRDTFTTEDVDDLRRELLESDLSPRTVQKVLVLLHGIFQLAKRRKLISSNPSADAERVTIVDDGAFNILEPVEFEAVHRAVLGTLDERPGPESEGEPETDAIDDLSDADREMFAALLSTMFYAGPRMGEVRDLQWRCVDFARALIRIESGFVLGERSTPKGKRARSTPLVPLLSQRLAALGMRPDFAAESDYVFCTDLGGRVMDKPIRAVFYAALVRAGLGHRRDKTDSHGNAQEPIRAHDLRHSYCTWAVNVWPVTKVKEFAGHADVKTTMRYVHHQTKADDAELGGSYLEKALSADAVTNA
jgi:integrase